MFEAKPGTEGGKKGGARKRSCNHAARCCTHLRSPDGYAFISVFGSEAEQGGCHHNERAKSKHAHHRPSCPDSSPLRQRAVSQHRHAGTTWIRSVRLHTIYAVEEVFAVVSGVRCALVGHCCELGFDSCQPASRIAHLCGRTGTASNDRREQS